MTFGNILTFIIICYIIYYVGMIAYDTYFKKGDIVQDAKTEEEEVDISDEVQQFQTVCVSKDKVLKPILSSSGEPAMSGGIEVDDLLPMTDELAEKGSQSILGQTLAVKWEEYIACSVALNNYEQAATF
jgi:hypothetical protein